jgi:chromosome segregation ATPase
MATSSTGVRELSSSGEDGAVVLGPRGSTSDEGGSEWGTSEKTEQLREEPGVLVAFYQNQMLLKNQRIGLLMQLLESQRVLYGEKVQECEGLREQMKTMRAEHEQVLTSTEQFKVQYAENLKALTAAQQDAAAKTESNAWLNRIIKQTQEDSRAMSSEILILQETYRATATELEETKARYGLLNQDAVRQLIEKQQDATRENSVLNQRLISKNTQVLELSEELVQMKNEFEPLKQQLDEATRERQALADENKLLKTQIASLQSAARTLRSKKMAYKKDQLAATTALRALLAQQTDVEAAMQRTQVDIRDLTARIEDLTGQNAALAEAATLAGLRENLLHHDLQVAREEKKAKDKQIRELRDTMTYLNEKLSAVMPLRERQANAVPAHLADAPVIEHLKDQLADSVAACRAHQSQNGFLAQELVRLERERKAQLELKDSTISRLAQEVETLRTMLAGHLSDDPRAFPHPPPLSAAQVHAEDLKTELGAVKRDFFFALLQSIKLQSSLTGDPLNIDGTELYGKLLQEEVPYSRWPEWINAHISRTRPTATVTYVSPVSSRVRHRGLDP